MAFVIADRVQETGTVSTGTGTVNLAGAVLGYQSFVSGVGSTNTTYYCIYDPAAYLWEVGLGTVTAGTPNTLARTTVYANSAGTQPSKISFSTSDTLTVFVTQPAETAIYTGASASLNSLSTTASTTSSTNMGPFNYGTLNYSDTGIVASYQTSVNSYFQMILQNTNNGTSASTDYIVSSNNGTSTTNYGDFGINSSSFSSGTGALNQPSTVYLYSQSTDLAIGTNSSNALHLVVNGAVNATDAMTINAASSVAFNGQYGSLGQQLISQGSSNPPIWANAGGTVTVTDFTATSGQTTFSVSYVIGTVSVYRNGIRLGQSDFTATNGTTVVLNTGAVAGDLIEVQSFTTLNIYTNITSQDFSGTGSQTVFTMNSAPGSSAALLVVISGVVQDPANYTVSGTTLTFTTAPAAGTNNISVRYLGQQSTTNVASFSGGTTGLSPTSAATGAVTLSGILNVANGGTGLATLTAGYIPYGNGTSAFSSSANMTFSGTALTLVNDASISGLTVGKGGGAVASNTVLGAGALAANTTAYNTVAVGNGALAANTTGYNGVAIGYQALNLNTTGISNIAIGAVALSSNLTGTANIAIGEAVLLPNTASYNTGVGYNALRFNTSGANNTAQGYEALFSNTTASNNTAVGYQAGYSNTTGSPNSYFGAYAGYATTTGNSNSFFGENAGTSNTSGSSNAFFGQYSGALVSTGSYNTIIGSYSGNQGGLDIRTASNYIVLSDGAGNPRQVIDSSGNLLVGLTSASGPGYNNANTGVQIASDGTTYISKTGNITTVINNNTSGNLLTQFSYQGTLKGSISLVGTTAVAFNTTSDYRLKENIALMTGALEKVSALKPCTYTWKTDGSASEGFIAHELAEVCPQAVVGEKDAVDAEGKPIYQGIDTSFLVATLTAAIQELSAKVDAQATTIAALQAKVGA